MSPDYTPNFSGAEPNSNGGPTQTIYCGWIDSDAMMLISVKLLTKYIVKMYALGSVHEKYGVGIIAVPKSLQRRNSRPG